jgi:hypothetical protein
MVIEEVPVLLRVSVCGLLDPSVTLPKFRVVALACSVPVESAGEFVPEFPFGVLAPVKPTQPDRDRAASAVNSRAKMPSGARRLRVCVCVEWERKVV